MVEFGVVLGLRGRIVLLQSFAKRIQRFLVVSRQSLNLGLAEDQLHIVGINRASLVDGLNGALTVALFRVIKTEIAVAARLARVYLEFLEGKRNGSVVGSHGLCSAARCAIRVGEIADHGGIVRDQRDPLLKHLHRLGVTLQEEIYGSKIRSCDVIVRRNLQGLLERLDALRPLALVVIGSTQVLPALGIVGLEFGDALIFGFGFVVVAKTYVGPARSIVIHPVIRINLHGLLQLCEGLIFFPKGEISFTQPAIAFIGIRRQLNRFF